MKGLPPALLCLILLLSVFAGCGGVNKNLGLPSNLSETSVYKAFIQDTEVDNFSYIVTNVSAPIDKKTFIWAQELMSSEEKVKDMRFLSYAGFDIGVDGKSDNYIICGYSDSFERVFYLRVENGKGYAYEVKKQTEFIYSSIDTTSKMADSSNLVAEAIRRGGECPEGVILELNSSRTKASIGCPGRWKFTDIDYLKFSAVSSGAATGEEE